MFVYLGITFQAPEVFADFTQFSSLQDVGSFQRKRLVIMSSYKGWSSAALWCTERRLDIYPLNVLNAFDTVQSPDAEHSKF